MRGVVQGSKRRELLDLFKNLIVNKYRVIEVRTALYYAVTDRGDLAEILDRAVLGVDKSVFDRLKSLSVVFHLCFALDFLTVVCLKADERAVGTDPLAVSFCEHALVCHIDKLIFK